MIFTINNVALRRMQPTVGKVPLNQSIMAKNGYRLKAIVRLYQMVESNNESTLP
jgi:hypothetical protein